MQYKLGMGVLTACLLGILVFVSTNDPNAKYRDAQLRVGMSKDAIVAELGEPDTYDDCWNTRNDTSTYGRSEERDTDHVYHVENLLYGPFGVYYEGHGHFTQYRIRTTFVDGRLREWSKLVPIGEE